MALLWWWLLLVYLFIITIIVITFSSRHLSLWSFCSLVVSSFASLPSASFLCFSSFTRYSPRSLQTLLFSSPFIFLPFPSSFILFSISTSSLHPLPFSIILTSSRSIFVYTSHSFFLPYLRITLFLYTPVLPLPSCPLRAICGFLSSYLPTNFSCHLKPRISPLITWFWFNKR